MADKMPVDADQAKKMEAERVVLEECYKLARRLIKVAGGRDAARGYVDPVQTLDEVIEANEEDLRSR